MIIKRPLEEIEEEFIEDFRDGMLTRLIEEKYGWSWCSLRKILKKKGIPFRARGGHRDGAGRKFGVKNRWGAKV